MKPYALQVKDAKSSAELFRLFLSKPLKAYDFEVIAVVPARRGTEGLWVCTYYDPNRVLHTVRVVVPLSETGAFSDKSYSLSFAEGVAMSIIGIKPVPIERA